MGFYFFSLAILLKAIIKIFKGILELMAHLSPKEKPISYFILS
jgi:hypothetical protein